MSKKDVIEHQGVVLSVSKSEIRVSIIQASACSSCHSKSACGVSDSSEKIVEIVNLHDKEVAVGQHVTIYMAKQLGIKAVLFGYVFPFFVLLAVLIALTSLDVDEGAAGLYSMGSLIPYYLLLYVFRKKLKSSFEFRLK